MDCGGNCYPVVCMCCGCRCGSLRSLGRGSCFWCLSRCCCCRRTGCWCCCRLRSRLCLRCLCSCCACGYGIGRGWSIDTLRCLCDVLRGFCRGSFWFTVHFSLKRLRSGLIALCTCLRSIRCFCYLWCQVDNQPVIRFGITAIRTDKIGILNRLLKQTFCIQTVMDHTGSILFLKK